MQAPLTPSELPKPLTPEECNLRGFQWMPIDTVRLLDSDLFLIATGDEFKAALALWCKSWAQVPAASLPSDERLLAGLSGAKNWKKVRDVAMRGWVLCSDGRYYHPVVAEKALEALVMAKAHAEQKAAASERKAIERADRSRMFAMLRERGIVADYHTSTSKLREMVAALPAPDGDDSSQQVTRDKSHPVTAKTGPEQTRSDKTVPTSSAPAGAEGADDAGQDAKAKKHGSEDDHKAVRWMWDRLRDANPATKEPGWDTWANDMRLMRERDGRTHREACELFGWAQRDAFWRSNILSPAKLREKWDQLVMKRMAPQQSGAAPVNKQQALEDRNRQVAAEWAAEMAAMHQTQDQDQGGAGHDAE